MALIPTIDASQIGSFTSSETTLTAADTLTYVPGRKQLLVLRNGTGGALTATVDGADGTTVTAAGLGVVSVAAGYAIAVPAGQMRAVVLSTISAYCQGVVALTGGAGLSATLYNL